MTFDDPHGGLNAEDFSVVVSPPGDAPGVADVTVNGNTATVQFDDSSSPHRELSDLPVLYADDKPVKRQGYMTHLITDEAVKFLREKHERPFFLYLPYTTPHFPYQGPGDENDEGLSRIAASSRVCL